MRISKASYGLVGFYAETAFVCMAGCVRQSPYQTMDFIYGCQNEMPEIHSSGHIIQSTGIGGLSVLGMIGFMSNCRHDIRCRMGSTCEPPHSRVSASFSGLVALQGCVVPSCLVGGCSCASSVQRSHWLQTSAKLLDA